MRTILTALGAVATLAAATVSGLAADSVKVTGAIVASAGANVRPVYVAAPDPGYIVYSDYSAALPGPTCYWTRMPVYDSERALVGWRGRPVAVCP